MAGSSIPGRSVILSSHGDNQSLAASWGSHIQQSRPYMSAASLVRPRSAASWVAWRAVASLTAPGCAFAWRQSTWTAGVQLHRHSHPYLGVLLEPSSGPPGTAGARHHCSHKLQPEAAVASFSVCSSTSTAGVLSVWAAGSLEFSKAVKAGKRTLIRSSRQSLMSLLTSRGNICLLTTTYMYTYIPKSRVETRDLVEQSSVRTHVNRQHYVLTYIYLYIFSRVRRTHMYFPFLESESRVRTLVKSRDFRV